MDHMALTYLHHVPTYIRTAAIQLAMCCSEFRSQGFFFFFPPEHYCWHQSKRKLLSVCPKQTSEADRHNTYRYCRSQNKN